MNYCSQKTRTRKANTINIERVFEKIVFDESKLVLD
jgi:hypothetical protein